MLTEVRLPAISENVEAGDVVDVMVKAGDTIAEGDAIVSIEVEKAIVEVPSPVGGIVKEIHAEKGAKLKVGEVILTVEASGTGIKAERPMPVREHKEKIDEKAPEPAPIKEPEVQKPS